VGIVLLMPTKDQIEKAQHEAHIFLHRLWTKAVGTPGYKKSDWRDLDRAINNLKGLLVGREPWFPEDFC